jgi:hypothetical protein
VPRRAAGLNANAIARRVDTGRLHPLFRGVYAVGHTAITRDAWFSAATMSVGDDSAIAAISACQHYYLWVGLVREVHVVVPRRVRPQPRIRIHSVKSAPDFREVRGVRVVEPAIAVVQFAAIVSDVDAIKRVAREAQFRELATHDDLLAVCSDGARGAGRLKLALKGGSAPTRNGGEDAALDFLRSCGLDPLVNHPLLGFVADFFLPEHRLVVEFDGRVHKIPIVRGDDHERQAVFEAAGYRVIRLTWRDITALRGQTRARVLAATVT